MVFLPLRTRALYGGSGWKASRALPEAPWRGPAVPRSRWRGLVVLATIAYGVLVGRQDLAEYLHLRRQTHVLQAELRQALDTQAALRARIAYAESNAFVAAQARQEFGFVAPGEVPLAPIGLPAAGGPRGAGHPAP
jgi:hypothetical protein